MREWDGKLHAEGGSGALVVVEGCDGAMVGLEDPAAEGEPDAGSILLGGEEEIEDFWQVIGVDAGAVVAD